MSARPTVWAELRCNEMRSRRCQSSHNDGPKGWVRGSRDIDAMLRRARKAGWHVGDSTVCPECAKELEVVE